MVHGLDHYARLFVLVIIRGVPVGGPGENQGLAAKGILWRSHPFRGRSGKKKTRILAMKGMKDRRRSFRGASNGTDMLYSGQTGRTDIPL